MNAVSVYVHTAQLLLRLDTTNTVEQFSDLNRLLGHLRQLLACAVCSRLLNDPFAPRDKHCNHNVCRVCIRGRKSLRPPCLDCKDCQDFKTYIENPQMRCLLLCFKSLCEHIMSAKVLFQQLCRQKQTTPAVVSSQPSTVPIGNMSAQEYIEEGANYTDITSAFTTDLPRSTPINVVPRLHVPQVPPLATSAGLNTIMPSSALHLLAQTQTTPKAETPPACVLSNSTSNSTSSNNNNINNNINATTPTAIVIKKERSPLLTNSTPTPPPAPPPPLTAVTITGGGGYQQLQANTNSLNATQPTMHFKHFTIKQATQTSNNISNSNTNTSYINNNTTINYTGPNAPSVVLPHASSSATTHAPLSIASSRLQSLNRQLAQARRPAVAVAATPAGTANVGEAVPPLAFKVSLASTLASVTTANTTSMSIQQTTNSNKTISNAVTTPATMSSQQARNPPPIKTVSNGSAMYSVLYTGIGNKITIKRKTDADDEASMKKTTLTTSSNNNSNTIITHAPTTPAVGTVFRQVTISKTPTQSKRRGCRCGNATPTPGKLTCCGQRCPCYVESKSCIGCKCRGCRNPHRPDGGKVRPVIPELACYEIQMADESLSLSPPNPQATTMSSTTTATTTLPMLKHNFKQQTHNQNVTQMEDVKPLLSTLVPQKSAPAHAPTSNTTMIMTTATTPSFTCNNNNTQTVTVTPTATLIPFVKHLQTTSTSTTTSQQQQQQQTNQQLQRFSTFAGNVLQQQQQPTQQTHFVTATSNPTAATNSSTNILQLEHLQRESVLIQNADGQYQVVNLFTTGPGAGGVGAGVGISTTLQRVQAFNCANSLNSSATTTSSSNNNNSNTGLQQIIFQQQHQPRQHQQYATTHQRLIANTHVQTPTPSPTSPTSTLTKTSLQQLQQQFKKNNLITLSATSFQQQLQLQQQQQHHQNNSNNIVTPLISPTTATSAAAAVSSASNATIKLSPIIVTSPNTLTSDMFSSSDGSGDEFMTINNLASAAMATATASTSPNLSNGGSSNSSNTNTTTTHLIPMPTTTDSTQFSTISIDNIDGGSSNNAIMPIVSSSAAFAAGVQFSSTTATRAHLTPALVEVIDSNELMLY